MENVTKGAGAIVKLIRGSLGLLWFVGGLLSLVVALSIWALSLTTQVASLSAGAAAAAAAKVRREAQVRVERKRAVETAEARLRARLSAEKKAAVEAAEAKQRAQAIKRQKIAVEKAEARVRAKMHARQQRRVLETKAKARLTRAFTAVPVIGLAAVGFFEELDYREWQEENPDGTRADYACLMAGLTSEVAAEIVGPTYAWLETRPYGIGWTAGMVRTGFDEAMEQIPECEVETPEPGPAGE